jgi:hypothetical protein
MAASKLRLWLGNTNKNSHDSRCAAITTHHTVLDDVVCLLSSGVPGIGRLGKSRRGPVACAYELVPVRRTTRPSTMIR